MSRNPTQLNNSKSLYPFSNLKKKMSVENCTALTCQILDQAFIEHGPKCHEDTKKKQEQQQNIFLTLKSSSIQSD